MPPKIIGGGSINELIEALQGGSASDGPSAPKSPPDVLIITLREYLEDYNQPCRFKPGDLVTAKKSGPMSAGHGDPLMVVEVFDPPIRMQGRADKLHNMEYGAKVDVRVVHEMHGHIVAHCIESWMLEPYVALADQTATAN